VKRAWRWPIAGFVLGGVVGATILTVNVVGASRPSEPPATRPSFGEILHTPPLLVRSGDGVELAYDVVCGSAKDEPGGTCDPTGSVFVRAVGSSDFGELSLVREPNGLLSAEVPARYTGGDGFDYYAEIDNGRGLSATLPQGAAEAPQHAWFVPRWTTVDLGTAQFGRPRSPTAVVASLSWGNGPRALGLDSGRERSRIGPSAFDIAPDGSVVVLDQVNRRLAFLRRVDAPSYVPIDFTGGEGDLAVGREGTIYVLDQGRAGSMPFVRSYGPAGGPIAGTPLGEPTADMLRAGPSGPVVHAYPSEMWLPTGGQRPPLAPGAQIAGARAARSVDGGAAMVVRASPGEARLALVQGDRVVRSWFVRSTTNLGEVQLAEPYEGGLLVVVRVWTEKEAEFRVLRLAPSGLASSFAVAPAEWAETASLSRFRLHGSTLYQLRSGPSGVEIAAFEIGGSK